MGFKKVGKYLYDYSSRFDTLFITKDKKTTEYSKILERGVLHFDKRGNVIGMDVNSIISKNKIPVRLLKNFFKKITIQVKTFNGIKFFMLTLIFGLKEYQRAVKRIKKNILDKFLFYGSLYEI